MYRPGFMLFSAVIDAIIGMARGGLLTLVVGGLVGLVWAVCTGFLDWIVGGAIFGFVVGAIGGATYGAIRSAVPNPGLARSVARFTSTMAAMAIGARIGAALFSGEGPATTILFGGFGAIGGGIGSLVEIREWMPR